MVKRKSTKQKVRFYNGIKSEVSLEPRSIVAIKRQIWQHDYGQVHIDSTQKLAATVQNRSAYTTDAVHSVAIKTPWNTALPGQHDPIIQDDRHVLEECLTYEDIRMQLRDSERPTKCKSSSALRRRKRIAAYVERVIVARKSWRIFKGDISTQFQSVNKLNV